MRSWEVRGGSDQGELCTGTGSEAGAGSSTIEPSTIFASLNASPHVVPALRQSVVFSTTGAEVGLSASSASQSSAVSRMSSAPVSALATSAWTNSTGTGASAGHEPDRLDRLPRGHVVIARARCRHHQAVAGLRTEQLIGRPDGASSIHVPTVNEFRQVVKTAQAPGSTHHVRFRVNTELTPSSRIGRSSRGVTETARPVARRTSMATVARPHLDRVTTGTATATATDPLAASACGASATSSRCAYPLAFATAQASTGSSTSASTMSSTCTRPCHGAACPLASTPPRSAPCTVIEPASVRKRSSRRTCPPETAFATSAGSRGNPSRSTRSVRPPADRPVSGRIADRRQIRHGPAVDDVSGPTAGRWRVAADHAAYDRAHLGVGFGGEDQHRTGSGLGRPREVVGARRTVEAGDHRVDLLVGVCRDQLNRVAGGDERVLAGQDRHARAVCAGVGRRRCHRRPSRTRTRRGRLRHRRAPRRRRG